VFVKVVWVLSHIPVGGFSTLLAVLGAIVSILEFKGWKRWFFAFIFLLLGAGEWTVLIRNDNAMRKTETARQNQEQKFQALVMTKLDQIVNSPPKEQKQVAIQVKKDLLYDPSVLRRMSAAQLKDAEVKLSAEMVDFESKRDNEEQQRSISAMNKIGGIPDSDERQKASLELLRETTAASNVEAADFRKEYLNRASALRDEILFRLRKTPEQSEEEVLSSLPPMVRMLHSSMPISRALGGVLNGPHAISDAALYLDAIARALN
jgi:hypothetical protein